MTIQIKTKRIKKGNMQVANILYDLITDEILPETGIDSNNFWQDFDKLIHNLAPLNRALLLKRDILQQKINIWHLENKTSEFDFVEYKKFLQDIGYLVLEGDKFSITSKNIDDEICKIAGPQLVVPVMNARFAINAANARWGSLYDAFYGTDIIPNTDGLSHDKAYNEKRGDAVIKKAMEFLDFSCPIIDASHIDVTKYHIIGSEIIAAMSDGSDKKLIDNQKFIGYLGDKDTPSAILLKNNNLHLEIQIDRNHAIGKSSKSGVKDIMLESAISVIQDCEDSVAAVDAEDKTLVYRNWLGLMKGDLSVKFEKNGKSMTRNLAKDRNYISSGGGELTLAGRSLLLVRNVGHLMTNNAILLDDGSEIPEGIMDAVITSLCAIHDFNKKGINSNSRAGSIYIVKPKMHGVEEANFTNQIFSAVEKMLKLPENTIKVGVMDEERRTTVNLKETIRAVKDRIFFINTGFLDRTGDEIHTSMEAGAFLPKDNIKQQPWISSYENWNVDIGLECGFNGKAQIGKGMWPKPDEMANMYDAKIGHVKEGANCAWVPSPTAATIHVMHYHKIDVFKQQLEIIKRPRANIDNILTIPLLDGKNLSEEQISKELENNVQGLLGYMVRWIDQGIGCSKVPDINNVGLMEDRATLRISSQHISNWLHHGICTKQQVIETLKRMAVVVDKQNSDDKNYNNMSPDFDNNIAFQAALEIIFEGIKQPSGYTEPILHRRRLEVKAAK